VSVPDKTDHPLTKIAMLPRILEAATLLHELGLLEEQPNESVKRYVQANPDINQYITKATREMAHER
jgi:hypothetical protein